MEVNDVLLSLALMGGAVLVVRSVSVRTLGWVTGAIYGLLVLAITGVTYLTNPAGAGYAGFAAWIALSLGPSLVAAAGQRAVDRRDLRAASRYTKILAIVHPSPLTKLSAVQWESESLVAAGDLDGARKAVARLAAAGGVIAIWGHASELRFRGAWRELADYLGKAMGDREAALLPSLVDAYLRALGESGQRKKLVREFARLDRFVAGDALARHRAAAWLVVLAFSGRADDVERVLATRLATYRPTMRTFWRATALLANGQIDAAMPLFEDVARSSDTFVARSAERRIREGERPFEEPIGSTEHAVCDLIMISLDEERRFSFESQGRGRPWAVLSMVAANTAMFAVELATGDTTDGDTLERLGALKSSLVIDHGGWWRMFACLFLHAGMVHLAMNMVGLFVIGPLVEFAFGRVKWLFVYLGSGLAGSVMLTLLPALGRAKDDDCVGASGCIMGLLGATMAIALVGHLRDRAPVAKRRLIVLGLLVALQTVFDFQIPEVSFTAHASGLVMGFVLGVVFALASPKPESSGPARRERATP